MPDSYQELRARIFGLGQGRDLPLIMQLLESTSADGPEGLAVLVGGIYDLDALETKRLADELTRQTGVIFPYHQQEEGPRRGSHMISDDGTSSPRPPEY